MIKFTGEHLQLLCSIKKCKQQTMAKKLFLSQQMISKLFRKEEIPEDKFELYIQALDLTMDQAIDMIKKFTPPPPRKNEKYEQWIMHSTSYLSSLTTSPN